MDASAPPAPDRRSVLRAALASALLLPLRRGRSAESAQPAIVRYLAGLARPDGGFDWGDQPDSHLTPTWAVVGCHHLLGAPVPRRADVAAFVQTHHPIRGEASETKGHAADLRSFVIEQIEALTWLGEDCAEFAKEVSGWTKPTVYPTTYEETANPILRQEVTAIRGRGLLHLPLTDLSPELPAWLEARRRPDGSFNNTPAAAGGPGHVVNTWWALSALMALRRAKELRGETVAWLRACQLPGGGFAWSPRAEVGGRDDVWYTWAAVRSLALLGGEPADRAGCLRWLGSLQNGDSGFGDRPGLPSSPLATYFALDALTALGGLETLDPSRRRPANVARKPLSGDLRVFTMQIEAPGNGSPVEAAELARSLGIHLWCAKNSPAGWVEAAQTTADARGVPVRFAVGNEEYGTYFGLPGFGYYSHLSDPIAPAGRDFGPPLAGRKPSPSWQDFRRERLEPLSRAGGRMVWQICDNEEFSRVLLDDSLLHPPGYAALSSFHFAQNFNYTLPWHFRYRHEIPFVALQDAHGDESWWWVDDLVGYRTLFLATEPTWDGWLAALDRNLVVAARHDAVTRFRTRLLGGAPGVPEYVRAKEADWRWWGERPDELPRPWVSVVAVTPDSRFEAAKPAAGTTLRVRTWWRTGQGRPKQPLVELVSLTLDGREVATKLVEPKDHAGQRLDVYHTADLADWTPGGHEVVVTSRRIAGGEVRTDRLKL